MVGGKAAYLRVAYWYYYFRPKICHGHSAPRQSGCSYADRERHAFQGTWFIFFAPNIFGIHLESVIGNATPIATNR